MNMKRLLAVACVCFASLCAYAQETGQTVTTQIQLQVQHGKAAELGEQANELVALVGSKQFEAASQRAHALREAYEKTFDSSVKQFSFSSQAEFVAFSQSTDVKFEWIDWGYTQCLHMQAFLAVEKKDFATALALLDALESIAPMSAGTPAETGYIYNRLGKPEQGFAAYRRALTIAERYPTQSSFRALALRGMGSALIDFKQWSEAERLFRQSLDLDPDNKVALHELAYIKNMTDSTKGQQ